MQGIPDKPAYGTVAYLEILLKALQLRFNFIWIEPESHRVQRKVSVEVAGLLFICMTDEVIVTRIKYNDWLSVLQIRF